MSNIAAILERDPQMNPGWRPSGHRVLVMPLLTKRVTAGGIALPDQLADREDMAQVEALVIAVGPACWKDQPGEPWCKEGDIVLIAKYGGIVRKGLDGRTYRTINDLDVWGVCDA